MAKTLCDTNILIDLFGAGQNWHDWSRRQVAVARGQGPLAVNPLIVAEFSVGFSDEGDVFELLGKDAFEHEPLPWNAAFRAGSAFLTYRRRGGDKRSPLPDFYIGAHALLAGHRLLTRDAARYRAYFPDLEIVCPETHP
ncbi:type II toxin-antitoxin system VapC family toxin [Aureimonas populi]|uniref:Type II toxin-antitoxin system VapC family toxin n=1 Tax=Aureimonas populi TaxID=1701758 RepID=A0ABW5CHB0_9HYPH|nr:type II toxin-antitoxin system VapC family toxin [Aureimonas populi]